EEESDARLSRLHRHLVAIIKKDKRSISCHAHIRFAIRTHDICLDRNWVGGVAERSRSFKNVRKRVPVCFDGKCLSFSRRHPHVEITWIRGNPINRTALSPEVSADDTNDGSVV